MQTLAQALSTQSEAARKKVGSARRPARYLVAAMLAGAYIGVGVVLMVATAGPFLADGAPAERLVAGGVFAAALTLVVFAGAELFTGNVMVMVQGWWKGGIRARDALVVGALSLFGNLVGSVLLALAVHAGGTTTGPIAEVVGAAAAAKAAATGGQLFWRAVLCNALVCLALWMAARATSDGAKLAVLWWGLLAFIGAGFEHSVANMTTFSLAALDGSIGWGALARNLLWTVPGNIVGGGLVVGLGYAWIGSRRPARASVPVAAAAGPVVTATATD